jgi:hypothetical protein
MLKCQYIQIPQVRIQHEYAANELHPLCVSILHAFLSFFLCAHVCHKLKRTHSVRIMGMKLAVVVVLKSNSSVIIIVRPCSNHV